MLCFDLWPECRVALDDRADEQVFCHPPYMHLPGQRLPTITSAERLIPYRAKPDDAERYTRLTLRHAEKATDTAIAGLIHSMPQLEEINLKGCSLAGQRTVEIICKRCKGIKKLNLKGTSVNEEQMRELLDTFGTQLEVFKIDRVVIEVSHSIQSKSTVSDF